MTTFRHLLYIYGVIHVVVEKVVFYVRFFAFYEKSISLKGQLWLLREISFGSRDFLS